jgi:hypothetical protein
MRAIKQYTIQKPDSLEQGHFLLSMILFPGNSADNQVIKTGN